MSEFSSVLELAREMADQASRIKSGQKAEETARRVQNRVIETEADLQKLGQAVTAARRLAAVSGVAATGLTELDDGCGNLERLARQSSHLPSDLAFNGARKKIGEVTRRVVRDFGEAWTQWAAQAVAEVPSIKLSQLEPADQAAARERWEALVKLSKVVSPATGDINMFKSDLDYLHEVLEPLPPLSDQVRKLYDRLARQPYLSLAEIADERIAQLRENGLDAQIEVRRRGA
jgi:hypothetical protein